MHSVVLMVSPPMLNVLQTCVFLYVHVHGIFVGMWGETLYCTIATRPNH